MSGLSQIEMRARLVENLKSSGIHLDSEKWAKQMENPARRSSQQRCDALLNDQHWDN
jgi:hypothetical protein